MDPREIVRHVAERWNSGDLAGMLDLYADDVVVQQGEHWPERQVLKGKAAFRQSIDEWLSAWQSVQIETDQVDLYEDRVVARGAWRSTGRISGVAGEMPIHIMFTVRDGKIARVDWFPDHERAVAAARGG